MNRLLLALATIIVVAGFSPQVSAQGGRTPPPGAGDKSLGSDVMPGVKDRSNEIERIKRDADKPEKKSEPESVFPQIKEDFEQIQHLNTDVLQAKPAGGATPDYAHILEAAADVKKRAARLKSNLFGVDSGKPPKEKEEKTQPDLKSLLSALDTVIDTFVHSPVFQNTKVVNPDDSAKAKHDLEEVIKLSGRVEKEAERLKKEKGV